MPFINPLETEGGPANSSKREGIWWYLGMSTYWIEIDVHDDEGDVLESEYFMAQYHKATMAGSLGSSTQGRIRKSKGEDNVSPYRVIVKTAPHYWAIFTSEEEQDTKEAFRALVEIVEPQINEEKEKREKEAAEQLTRVLGRDFINVAYNSEKLTDLIVEKVAEYKKKRLESEVQELVGDCETREDWEEAFAEAQEKSSELRLMVYQCYIHWYMNVHTTPFSSEGELITLKRKVEGESHEKDIHILLINAIFERLAAIKTIPTTPNSTRSNSISSSNDDIRINSWRSSGSSHNSINNDNFDFETQTIKHPPEKEPSDNEIHKPWVFKQ
eukprot:TRINITY_DN10188_c0_g1_i1.p1 TRINITY_DN10188_c0_g1~~TRINITY_DN10188_c0_g1_i1.p1  ORF type:complete len:328 (-),score=66.41 TRINITY_DN10188_c0_g1_i1:29-1012(-)